MSMIYYCGLPDMTSLLEKKIERDGIKIMGNPEAMTFEAEDREVAKYFRYSERTGGLYKLQLEDYFTLQRTTQEGIDSLVFDLVPLSDLTHGINYKPYIVFSFKDAERKQKVLVNGTMEGIVGKFGSFFGSNFGNSIYVAYISGEEEISTFECDETNFKTRAEYNGPEEYKGETVPNISPARVGEFNIDDKRKRKNIVKFTPADKEIYARLLNLIESGP
ncbi:MAG: hypothetical protein KKF44_09870 [Nanoarchaeota archaeon]|nr:hypothetical protein [Nanoarchaeota archaeon]